MELPCRGVLEGGEVARLIVRQSAHDYMEKSFVIPVKELRAEILRHKRQKKDAMAPEDMAKAMYGNEEGEEEGEEANDGDRRPPPTHHGAFFNKDTQVHTHKMRTNREKHETTTAGNKERTKQKNLDKLIADGMLHATVTANLRDKEPQPALEYFFSLDPGDLKRVLTHLKVTLSNTGKKEMQTLLRDHLPQELAQKLQEAQTSLQQDGEARARADAEDLQQRILSLEPKEALHHFNKVDSERAKSVLAHYKVPLDIASTKKQLLQLLLESLPAPQQQRLQAGQQQVDQEVIEREAAKNTARIEREARQLQKSQKQAAAHADLLRTLESLAADPAAALEYLGKMKKGPLTDILLHLKVPHEKTLPMDGLQELVKNNEPACAPLRTTST